MKILNFGSLNIDYIYNVKNFVSEGETIPSLSYSKNCGGKGLNQAIALSRVSNDVYFAGQVGQDGKFLVNELYDNNVNTEYIGISNDITGHAVIQVNGEGENCIITFGGANHKITKKYIDDVINKFDKGDMLFVQNEISNVDYVIKKGYEKGLKIVYNPSPIIDVIDLIDFSHLEYLVINHHEGMVITGKKDNKEILEYLTTKHPNLKVILTASEHGAYYAEKGKEVFVSSLKVKVADTTCAGDTFLGFFIGGIIKNKTIRESMELATKAAAIAITRSGASRTIPKMKEVI